MNGFIRKKVKSLTLGERLRKIREDMRVSLDEVAEVTRIQKRYLEYLENGNYDKLPADVYVRGFLRGYSDYLGTDSEKLIYLFEKERGIQNRVKNVEETVMKKKKIKISGFLITPRVIGVVAVIAVFVLAFFYLYKELNNFVSTPRLVINHPISAHENINGNTITFDGVTDLENEVFINDKKISIDDRGGFLQEVSLSDGVNVIIVRAINRFEKESKKEFFVNKISENKNEAEISNPVLNKEDANNADSKEEFSLVIVAIEKAIDVSVKSGSDVVYSGVIHPDYPQKITIYEDVNISSSDGINTKISVNDKERGVLSDEEGKVDDVLVKVVEESVDLIEAVEIVDQKVERNADKKK